MKVSLCVGTGPAVEEQRHAYNQEELFLMTGESQIKQPPAQKSPMGLKCSCPLSQPAESTGQRARLCRVEHGCHKLAQQHSHC